MDAHLVLVPGLRTLTVGGLTGGDLKGLGGKTDGTLDVEGLGAGTLDQLRANLLEGGDLARGKGDTDLVDLLLGLLVWLAHCFVASLPPIIRHLVEMNLRLESCWVNVQGPRRNPSRASGKTS